MRTPKSLTTRFALLCVLLVGTLASAQASLHLADIFTNGAVLQRDREIPVWGQADPGATVTVGFSGKTQVAVAGKNGKWQLRLPAMPANLEAQTLTVSSDSGNTIKLDDILIGDVWLCSGQSNMAMRVDRSDNLAKETAAADLPGLRVFTVARKASPKALDTCAGEWIASDPETAGKFSATAFFFGREIHEHLDGVPIGLIVAAWSGSAIEAWTSAEIQQKQPYLQPLLESWQAKDTAYTPDIAAAEMSEYETALSEWQKARDTAKQSGIALPKKPRRPIDPHLHHHHPAVLFNGMISPIIPYAIRGAIWYQGETNGLTTESAALYDRQLPLLIKDWRSRWKQDDFPFGCMQLPGVRAQQVDWPPVREAMRLARKNLPEVGMAVTLDLSDASLLHPTNKQDFAHRLALWARSEVYQEDIVGSGPRPTGHRIEKNTVIVDFSHTADGLIARDGAALKGFDLRSADGSWLSAQATIVDASVHVKAAGLPTPTAVRYAWSNHPKKSNLFNSADLPASPFQLGDTRPAPKTAPARIASTPAPTDPPLIPVDISKLPDDNDQLDIFLLIGQSNMKGRGVMPAQAANDPQIAMMHKGTDQWFVARHPLHLVGDPQTFKGHDNAGVGPGLSFAETVIRHRPSTRIALVPCAVGGSRIGVWGKGARLYEDAVRRATLALENGPEGKTRFAGALWLQGESDAREERLPLYADALADLVKNLRADLNSPELPFIAVTIGEMRDDHELREKINLILLDLPEHVEHTAAVDARDLKGHIGDNVHFDTATQNEIGRRFARTWLKMPASKLRMK